MKTETGMGATICWFTDKDAATIIAVNKTGTRVTVQKDHAKRTDTNGMSEVQSYDYSPNADGETFQFSLRKNGRWILKGDGLNGLRLSVGNRRSYHDYSF